MSSGPTAPASATLRGGAWMTCAAASWTAMTALVRDLSADYSAFELLFARNLVAVSILLPPALRAGVASLKTRRLGLHSLRAVFSYLAVLGLFYAVSRLPLSFVPALFFWVTPDAGDLVRMIGIGLAGTLTVYGFACRSPPSPPCSCSARRATPGPGSAR